MSQSLTAARWTLAGVGVVVLLMLMQSPGVSAAQCTVVKEGCSCRFENGSIVDLTPLGNTDDTPKWQYADTYYTYTYNPCFPFSDGSGTCKNAAVCVKSSWNNDIRGEADTAKFSVGSDGLLHVSYTAYTASSTFSPDVALVCGTTEQFKLKDTAYYSPKFQLTSPGACPVTLGGSGGISGGSIMLIIFFSVVFVYLVAGVIFMHISRGARGVERIPNYEFWRSVPGLIKDGISFSFNKTTSSCKSSAVGYESVS